MWTTCFIAFVVAVSGLVVIPFLCGFVIGVIELIWKSRKPRLRIFKGVEEE